MSEAFSNGPRRAHGFTLLELLVVVAIIAMLAGYVGPRYFAQLNKSEVKIAKSQIQAFTKALDVYRLDIGHYPSTAEGLGALFQDAGSNSNWHGPYLEKPVPPDPWGNAYVYSNPGPEGKEYQIISYGRDGVPGGSGDDADLTN